MHEVFLDNLHLQDINPRISGEEKCAPGHAYGPARREFHLLHYVISGSGTLVKKGVSMPVRAGQIFVIRPGETTLYTASETDPWHYAWAGFDCAASFAALLKEDVITLPGALSNFQRMANCQDEPAREWFMCAQLYGLFAKLATAGEALPTRSGVYVRQALNYIEANYSQPIRVEAMAAGLGLDRSYFCRVFKAGTGLSPQRYIQNYKLEKAAAFLAGGLSPAEAASQVGYPDVFSFSRMFRKHYGVPPGQYARLSEFVRPLST